MFGFLNVNKPAGPTSHDVVLQVRRLIGRATGSKRAKVGHAGTLDPFADGVLVICLGPATRLAEYVQRHEKRYTAEVTLGATSITDDPEGQISQQAVAEPPTAEQVRETLPSFVGQIGQVPPAHSAVHVGGRRSYKIARAGEVPQLRPRRVRIDQIELLSYEWPKLAIDVRCGTGTYIRALARDIGARLGVGGYCSRLTRTQVGPFKLANSVEPSAIDLPMDLADPLFGLGEMERVRVSDHDARRLANGNPIDLGSHLASGEVAVLSDKGVVLAIGQVVGQESGRIQPTKVLAAGQTR